MRSFSFKGMRSTLLLLSVFVVALFGFSFLTANSQVEGDAVKGFAWSENTGWIQFDHNKSEPVKLASVASGVGTLKGYAWSEHIGWISFNEGDLYPCPFIPTEDGTSKQAKINFSTGKVTGWMRAIAGTGDNAQAGGWNGCIHLSGVNHASPDLDGSGGITYRAVDKRLIGYAWGGDVSDGTEIFSDGKEAVVGWVTFNLGVPSGTTPPPSCCGGGGPPTVGGDPITVTLTANGSPDLSIQDPNTSVPVTLTATITGTPSACVATMTGPNPSQGTWNGVKANVSFAEGLMLTNPGTYTFTLNCDGKSDSVPVTLTLGGTTTGTVNVICKAVDANGNPLSTVFVGDPITWQAEVQLVGNKPSPNYDFKWHGNGFSTVVTGSSPAPVIKIDRVYTTTGSKQVWIEITGTGAPNSIGSCEANPATVQVRAKPVFEPF